MLPAFFTRKSDAAAGAAFLEDRFVTVLVPWLPEHAQSVADTLSELSPTFKAQEDADPRDEQLSTKLGQVRLDATSPAPSWMLERAKGVYLTLTRRVAAAISEFAVNNLPRVAALLVDQTARYNADSRAGKDPTTFSGALAKYLFLLVGVLRADDIAVKAKVDQVVDGWHGIKIQMDAKTAFLDDEQRVPVDDDMAAQIVFLYVLVMRWLVPSVTGIAVLDYSGVDALRYWLLYKDDTTGAKPFLLNTSETHGRVGGGGETNGSSSGYDVLPFLRKVRQLADAGDPVAEEAYGDIIEFMSAPEDNSDERDALFEKARMCLVRIAQNDPSLQQPMLDWVSSVAP